MGRERERQTSRHIDKEGEIDRWRNIGRAIEIITDFRVHPQ